MEFKHTSVLLHETIDGLDISGNGIYVDCTTGGAGHSLEIAKRLTGMGKLFCFDCDKEALKAAAERLQGYNVTFINSNFSDIKAQLGVYGVTAVDGILMDLGVSSYQLDNPERGFSFHNDAPLDMRMSSEGLSAMDVLNDYSESDLERILYTYGEEKYTRSIVKGIIKQRLIAPIRTTGELAEIIRTNVPSKVRNEKNPCRKTFQAIRIEVNGELDAVKTGVQAAFSMLKEGGRLAVITFHSLEDRIVKNLYKEYITGCTCDKNFPICVCGRTPQGELLTKKPITATEEELAENNRSRSAKLRIIVKVGKSN